jgi:uncharacterized membrane protein YgdD (TMEM256/DUF423 family)
MPNKSTTTKTRVSNGWIRTVGLLGAVGVALGAFGAHGLKDRIAPNLLEVYRTGVLYHLLHTVALLGVVVAGPRLKLGVVTRWAFLLGVFVFSGTLYTLALTGLLWLGAITPVGGLAFIVGWSALFVGGVTSNFVPEPSRGTQ